MADAGVPKGAAQLTDAAMAVLIDEYCREAGVRNLKKQLEKIYRKVITLGILYLCMFECE